MLDQLMGLNPFLTDQWEVKPAKKMDTSLGKNPRSWMWLLVHLCWCLLAICLLGAPTNGYKILVRESGKVSLTSKVCVFKIFWYQWDEYKFWSNVNWKLNSLVKREFFCNFSVNEKKTGVGKSKQIRNHVSKQALSITLWK